MATKRKREKQEKPCGEGYRRVEIKTNEEQSSKPGTSEKKKKKFKCVKILMKPQKNSDPKELEKESYKDREKDPREKGPTKK
jgi:hypothetical protein